MNPATRRHLRAIGHHLHPIVTIGESGPGPGARDELARALHDHELVKIKVQVGERERRRELISALAVGLGAEVIQQIGKVALIYRNNPRANPRLSNILRAG